MKIKYNTLKTIKRIYKLTLTAVPISGIIGILNYLLQGLLPAITALIQSHIFDAAYAFNNNSTKSTTLFTYCGLFVISFAIIYIFQFVSSITINAGIYEKCTSFHKHIISQKTANLSLLSFEDSNILNLHARAIDCVNREILSQIYMSSTVFITSGISIISTISVLASYSVYFIPISIISVVPYFIVRIIRGKDFYRLKFMQSPKNRKLNYIWSLFSNKQVIKEMRLMGFSNYLVQKWSTLRDDVDSELFLHNVKDSFSLLLCDALNLLGYGISILLTLFLTIKGNISIGAFGACLIAFKSMQNSAKSFLIDLGNMPEKISFANDYFSYLDLPEDKDGTTPISGINNKITLSNVSFIYPNSNHYALKDISLTINRGEKIVILGTNGSGKTTLSKVILNIYQPTHGTIAFDTTPSADIKKSSLYNHVSIVAQDFVTYDLSIRENVAISSLSNLYDDDLIHRTLLSAGLYNIDNLDKQLGRVFGGTELSGGQQQKLAIARALFRQSELIILDEPTSALDPLMEGEILRQFIRLAQEKTAIIISHRVGLCTLADRIIVMKNGQICEIGNHNELLKLNGEYKKLYSAQEQWYS